MISKATFETQLTQAIEVLEELLRTADDALAGTGSRRSSCEVIDNAARNLRALSALRFPPT